MRKVFAAACLCAVPALAIVTVSFFRDGPALSATAAGQVRRLGEILMGFNRKSVPEAEVESLARRSGFEVTSVKRALHPGTVLAFRRP